MPAADIRRIAREIAEAAFEDTVDLPIPWTDWAGRRHETMTAGRSPCTPCAASRPTPTASTPAGRCTCCRCCWARSTRRAASATSRPSRAPARRARNRPGRCWTTTGGPSRTRRSAACRSASRRGRRTCWSTRRRANRGGSTRPSAGSTRSPRTA